MYSPSQIILKDTFVVVMKLPSVNNKLQMHWVQWLEQNEYLLLNNSYIMYNMSKWCNQYGITDFGEVLCRDE